MKKSVTIIDYGLGNLHSVVNALRYLGAEPVIAEDGVAVSRAENLILPGVGAFSEGMRGLHERGQADAILEYVGRKQGLLLGICLGAQLLLDESDEFGKTPGLGIIPGRVMPVPANGEKVPHAGWKPLKVTAGIPEASFMRDGTWVYFVHSFHAVPAAGAHVLATAQFGPDVITAAVGHGQVIGCQFHPEKSGLPGLAMMRTLFNL